MTLATMTGTPSLRRAGRLTLSLDAFLMAASLGVCAFFFAEGGIEAFIFAAAGAILGARNAHRGDRIRRAYSGGFAGLFIGAMFAAFFHGALVALVQTI